MIKELFESSFFHKKPIVDTPNINFIEYTHKGQFSLIDKLACDGCKRVCSQNINDRKQLLICSRDVVYVMKLDQLFKVIENAGENCDYMLDDSVVMALIEMTCTSSEYVESKRQKAISQLYSTLQTICENSDVRGHIEREEARFVIFSWKDTSRDESYDDVEKSMILMTEMSDEVYSIDNVSNFDFGFKFKEIRYPDTLNWDDLYVRQA